MRINAPALVLAVWAGIVALAGTVMVIVIIGLVVFAAAVGIMVCELRHEYRRHFPFDRRRAPRAPGAHRHVHR
jgi:hypothetical protein